MVLSESSEGLRSGIAPATCCRDLPRKAEYPRLSPDKRVIVSSEVREAVSSRCAQQQGKKEKAKEYTIQ